MPKQEKTLTMTVLMTPDMANFSGNVHGGSLLKLLDQVDRVILIKIHHAHYLKNLPYQVS